MTVPKANILYKNGSANTPTSLIDSSNFKTALITIDGSTYSLDSSQSFFQTGSSWNDDTVIWALGSGGPTLTSKNKSLKITINVTL